MVPPAAPPRRPVVLCLDDDPQTLGSFRRAFQKEPYDLVTTGNPDEALMRLHRAEVDVVLVDERMPDISGTAFLKMVELWSPETARLIVSGHPKPEDGQDGRRELVQHFVPKPWDDDQLRSLLRGLVRDRSAAPGSGPASPGGQESPTTRKPAGPDFMVEQPVLVECTGRSANHVMARLHPWLRQARAQDREVVAVVEGLPALSDPPAALMDDLRESVDVTGVRLHLLDGSGLARRHFADPDARHPRIVIPAAPAAPRELLLVDPVSTRRVFLKVLLSGLGHRCRAVETPDEARRALEAEPADLVLLETSGPEDDAMRLAEGLAGGPRETAVLPLLGTPRAWSPAAARKYKLRRPLVRPYRITFLADAVS